MQYVNNQTVPVKLIQKKKLAENIVQPGETIELNPEHDEIIAEDAP